MRVWVDFPDDKPRTEEENRCRKGIDEEGYTKRNLLGLLNFHSSDRDLKIRREDETKTGN